VAHRDAQARLARWVLSSRKEIVPLLLRADGLHSVWTVAELGREREPCLRVLVACRVNFRCRVLDREVDQLPGQSSAGALTCLAVIACRVWSLASSASFGSRGEP
jgi:hypothetical protein